VKSTEQINSKSPQRSMRYIGSKTRVVSEIMRLTGPPVYGGIFIDGFCGTGSVARAAAEAGWSVHLNDHLRCAVTLAAAGLTHQKSVSFDQFGGYKEAIQLLDSIEPRKGFIWSEYSPASAVNGEAKVERRYFTEHNGQRIDAVRSTIAEWKSLNLISDIEETLLIADLLLATNRVSNISGTYGCFLRNWQNSALQTLELRPRNFIEWETGIETSCLDVSAVESQPNDIVYLDPPYTKRQYAAYYHILETICVGDQPSVTGKTGLRPWRHLASPFCYKKQALGALTSLIRGLKARRILLSYSNEGHVDLSELTEQLQTSHSVEVHELATIGRYRPNQAASARNKCVAEYLLDIQAK
jgi:adenine-specific DNA-methyltransferase